MAPSGSLGITIELETPSENLLSTDPVYVEPAPSTPQTRELSGAHLLVVEDSPDNQDIFRFFLESAGARVEIVENGLDAVRRAASADFDLILMDIQIPEIDGKEATRRIRHQGYKKPIVALTAHAMADERASCIQAGCNGQITKPVSGELLIEEVDKYLKGQYELSNGHPRLDEATVH